MENKKAHDRIPRFEDMMIPTLLALKALGGSGSNTEINEKVYEAMNFDDEVLNIPHKTEGLQSEVDFRLTRARRYMRKYGLIEDSSRGVWSIVDNTLDPLSIDPKELIRKVRSNKNILTIDIDSESEYEAEEETIDLTEGMSWRSDLLEKLQNIDPTTFECLCAEILKNTGFKDVTNTGGPLDRGIDGMCTFEADGLVKVSIYFQCKKYRDRVKSKHLRDFRGAMQGNADKGMFFTTGRFSDEAIREATRDGVSKIDLIDGNTLCSNLKRLQLGIKTSPDGKLTIDHEWFEKLQKNCHSSKSKKI